MGHTVKPDGTINVAKGSTPGPWKIEPCLDGSIFIECGGKYIAHIETNEGKANEEDEANARLIAAAPELLKENELLKQEIEMEYHKNRKVKSLNAELLEVCKLLFDELMKSKSMIEPAKIAGAFGAINKASKLFDKIANV